ncbi:hypothetical protein PV325_005073 [Microctonus aethiopoides]|uniref:Ig-like domain-containing protein n=1 Tax=Microctonus aethiopoides TaxID=144406 RepID=A0AA39C9P7_9HYME|nr:hypothetical protein PV325_005073 [Microctonus aethiopoides]KAK0160511.1 hypothetical protein PV328_007915 [Microctonus aethiopoides]
MKHNPLSTLIIRIILIINILSEYEGVKIRKLELPMAVHNGTGPIELMCIYQIDKNEHGLVVKWYHNMEQIYQWIPPMSPQDSGIISGFTEYPERNINRPFSHSIIHLRQVNFSMTGDYTCSVSTFSEHSVETKKMTIYIPNHQLQIFANTYNDTHINLTCIAKGARPRPSLSIIINDERLEDRNIRVENYRKYPWIRQETIVTDFIKPVIVQCEINIPGTGYRKRDKLLYYQNSMHR